MSRKIAAPAKRIDPKGQPVHRSDDQAAPRSLTIASIRHEIQERRRHRTQTTKGTRIGRRNKAETEDGLKARDR
ncbi:hypothetical protein GGI59_000198 [Rhizobium lentis]|uniref:Uncharacterized protein n=1 Tax=Rhizobium lentis TaxID=1138194 RepID=A0A7W8UIC9_9HYPH|nr:hypothetical protein [Rhizobium lentis]MBB5548044.1 hypothetical protein [Rhizobium lentis]MBB5558571.1 hypothetical protein [Rhizobium lentis]MBB5565905.1 hypothetical protein [Rhizobium lentis]